MRVSAVAGTNTTNALCPVPPAFTFVGLGDMVCAHAFFCPTPSSPKPVFLVRYRVAYLAINVCAVALVSSIPGSLLWDEGAGEERPDRQEFALLFSAIIAANIAYLVLQVGFQMRAE